MIILTNREIMETSKETYKVVKIGRKSLRRKIIDKGLSLDEARRLVARYPDSSRSMVVFYKQ